MVLIVSSCAQMVAPTGGQKDTTPPTVVKTIPLQLQTSFQSDQIELKFNEYVQLKDPSDQIVISPPIDPKPEFTVDGKSINIEFRKNSLMPNQTYTINFGNSITDNHEGSILSDFIYVFSTGTQLDSLNVMGKVIESNTLKTYKGISVCLFHTDSFADSTIFKKKPIYFSKTNESGSFTIRNLPSGRFKLVAYNDENKNLKYDATEKIAFTDYFISSGDTTSHTLLLFQPDPYPINKLIDTFSRESGKFSFVLFNPESVSITPVIPVQYYTDYKPGKNHIDTLQLIHPDWGDSSIFRIKSPLYDTVVVVKSTKKGKIPKFTASISKSLELTDSIKITFSNPVKTYFNDTSFIVLKEDTTIVKPRFILDSNRMALSIYHPLKESSKYLLTIKDSAFIDVYGQHSKKDKVTYQTKGLKDYSNLMLNIIHPGNKKVYLVQLINQQDQSVYRTFSVQSSVSYQLLYLLPGKFNIKIIEDRNANGKWDNGHYFLKQQPENVYFYPEELQLRAYWDLEQSIDLGKIVN